VRVQGFQSGPDIDSNSRLNAVGPGYFSTLGIPLISGREFLPSDRQDGRPVAIVNEAFAGKFGLGREAVGKLMGRSGSSGELDIEIVGLVQDAKYSEVKGAIPPLFFTPYRQDPRIGSISFYVRTAIQPEQFLQTITRVVGQLDPDLPVEELRTMPQQVRENVFLDRFISTLSAAFAVLATLLAAIGLYGVLAYTVSQRTREFGLRMALGADGANVRSLVLKQVGLMAIIGGVIGLVMSYFIGTGAESQLFEVRGHDPIVFGGAFVLLGVVALGAGLLPALRASRIDPMKALRWE
jgi:predicted permease